MGAVLPGSGYLFAGRRLLAYAVLLISLLTAGAVVWWFGGDLRAAIDFAFDPTRLHLAAAAVSIALVLWIGVVLTTYLMVRPRERTRTQTAVGAAFAVGMCLLVAGPAVAGVRYAMVQADLLTTLFEDNDTATAPDNVKAEKPWGGRDRVNLLLLGGDGGVGRTGVRTDSIILASIDTTTGKTVTFSLPRNMMNAPFPADSPLHAAYPDGFTGGGDPGNWMLNAVYPEVPILNPGVLGKSDNEGADAIKQAVSGTLGIPVDYYLLVNLDGFKQIVDAIGGVTVNINERVAIQGNTDAGIPPVGYLEPGPDQHLDGFHALWFARGRYGSDDYQRMERQRCLVSAIIDEADPLTLLRRYTALADQAKKILRTDIPRELLPAFVDLTSRTKGTKPRSVVFRSSEEFNPADPDIDYVQATVAKALEPKKRPTGPRPKPQEKVDSCAYDATAAAR